VGCACARLTGGFVNTDQGLYASATQPSPVSETSARKLIDKLAHAGELRASFLMRVLREGQIELFDHGLATLLQLDVEPMRRALYGGNPHLVALACRAAGIDRAAFLTVFQLSRRHRQCGTALSEADREEIQAIFREVPKGDALQRLRGQAA